MNLKKKDKIVIFERILLYFSKNLIKDLYIKYINKYINTTKNLLKLFKTEKELKE